MTFNPGDLKDDPFVEAARNNDALAEEHGLPWVVEDAGLDLNKLMYLAEQRALRMVLLFFGLPIPSKITPIPLNAEQRALMGFFHTAILDGIMIGVKGSRTEDG